MDERLGMVSSHRFAAMRHDDALVLVHTHALVGPCDSRKIVGHPTLRFVNRNAVALVALRFSATTLGTLRPTFTASRRRSACACSPLVVVLHHACRWVQIAVLGTANALCSPPHGSLMMPLRLEVQRRGRRGDRNLGRWDPPPVA